MVRLDYLLGIVSNFQRVRLGEFAPFVTRGVVRSDYDIGCPVFLRSFVASNRPRPACLQPNGAWRHDL